MMTQTYQYTHLSPQYGGYGEMALSHHTPRIWIAGICYYQGINFDLGFSIHEKCPVMSWNIVFNVVELFRACTFDASGCQQSQDHSCDSFFRHLFHRK